MRNEITPAMLADIFSIKKETAEPFVQHLKNIVENIGSILLSVFQHFWLK